MTTIATHTASVAIFMAPDGSIKGGEVRQLTGYEKLVDVPDAPGGVTSVFYATEPEAVLAVSPADIKDYMPKQAAIVADAAAKADAIKALTVELDAANERATLAEAKANGDEKKLSEQAEALAELRAQVAAERQAGITAVREEVAKRNEQGAAFVAFLRELRAAEERGEKVAPMLVDEVSKATADKAK